MKISVGNWKTWRNTGSQLGVKIDRDTALGNKFIVGPDGDRAEVIEKYRKWLWLNVAEGDTAAMAQIRHIAQLAREYPDSEIVLLCWCAPEPCHADVIKGVVDKMLGLSTVVE